jgi:zinc protease
VLRFLIVSLTLLACRQSLPSPASPLTPTPDAGFRAVPPPLDPPRPARKSALSEERLQNGMTVIVAERPELPLASIVYANRRAHDADNPRFVGLALLTARALNEGTRLSDGRELAGLHFGGARPKPHADFAGTTIAVDTLASAAVPGIELLADLVRHPLLGSTGIDSARRVLADEAYGRSLGVGEQLRRSAYGALKGRTDPKGRPLRLTDAIVRRFYRERYGPADSALIVVGAVQTTEVLAAARAAFGDWSESTQEEPRPEVAATVARGTPSAREQTTTIHGLVGDGRQASFALALPCVGGNDPDSATFDVVALVLANLYGSRTMKALRHQGGLSYGIRAHCEQRVRTGVFWIEFSSDASEAGAALAKVLAEIRRLRHENVTPRELEVAKARLLGDVEGRRSSIASFAGSLASHYLLALEPNHHEAFRTQVANVDADALRRVVQRSFDETSMGVAVYGDPGVISGALARFGEVKWQAPAPD